MAARLGLTGVGISGPGLLLAHAKFGLDPQHVSKHTVNIVPDRDVVPNVDSQVLHLVMYLCSYLFWIDGLDSASSLQRTNVYRLSQSIIDCV